MHATTRNIGLLSGALLLTAGGASFAPHAAADDKKDGYEPNVLTLTATIRDFKAYNETGGHDDFQRFTGSTRVGIVADQLGEDGKPVLASQYGWKIIDEYKDSKGRNVRPQFVIDGTIAGTEGSLQTRSDVRVTSPESFSSWYNDVPGVNQSTVVPLTLVEKSPGSGVFVFDSANISGVHNPLFYDLPIAGFFPINDQLHGNYSGFDGGSSNFHFTTELRTTFTYLKGEDFDFTFSGDDDVWVFIDGKLVIDLGSLHSRREQTISLDSLPWLEDGKTYSLAVFHAERRTSASNFRIETSIPLVAYTDASTTDVFD